MKTILVKCRWCQKEILKQKKAYNRAVKQKRDLFCNHSCACAFNNKKRNENGEKFSLPLEWIGTGNPEYRRDNLSDFRPLYQRVKTDKNEGSISLKQIKELWEAQNGVCPYTGIKLTLPKWNKKKTVETASVDRINSKIGYTKENCQIISIMANLAKNDFTHLDMVRFCEAIRSQGKT
jgi:hypothetical protein